jgi:predicted outer membrane protein
MRARAACRVLLAAVLLGGGATASAQGWSGGIKAGVSHGGLTGNSEFAWEPALLSSAAFLHRPLTTYLALQPEVSYVRRIGVSTVTASTLTLTADYVELPVMLQLQAPWTRGVAPYVTAGPSVAFRVRCTLQFVGGGITTDDQCDNSSGARVNRVDVGLAAGVGLHLGVGATKLDIESRITTGLRSNVLPIDVANSRSEGWSVLAGVSMLLNPRRVPGERMPPSMDDATIATMVLAFDNTGISYARLVPSRTSRSDVYAFAQRMLTDNASINLQINDLLRTLDLPPVDSWPSLALRDTSVRNRDRIWDLTGVAFDSAYVANEIRFQREFLRSIDQVMLPRARSAALRRTLAGIRPVVMAHLAAAEEMRATVLSRR